MAAAKGKFISFARASKDRLSGRRLIQPSERRKQTHVQAFTSNTETRENDPDDEKESFLVTNSNGYSESNVSKVVQNPENCCIICVGSTGTGKSSKAL